MSSNPSSALKPSSGRHPLFLEKNSDIDFCSMPLPDSAVQSGGGEAGGEGSCCPAAYSDSFGGVPAHQNREDGQAHSDLQRKGDLESILLSIGLDSDESALRSAVCCSLHQLSPGAFAPGRGTAVCHYDLIRIKPLPQGSHGLRPGNACITMPAGPAEFFTAPVYNAPAASPHQFTVQGYLDRASAERVAGYLNGLATLGGDCPFVWRVHPSNLLK